MVWSITEHHRPPSSYFHGRIVATKTSGDALIDPVVGDVTPAASNLLGILYFGTLYGLTGHLQVLLQSCSADVRWLMLVSALRVGCSAAAFDYLILVPILRGS